MLKRLILLFLLCSNAYADLSVWSTTAADNDTAGSINFAESQAPNTVNDSARQLMADVRTFYEGLEWRDWGHTPVYSDANTFTVSSSSDLSSVYTVGRRVKITDSSTLYGIISVSSYAASTQTVDVVLDSGSLSASLTNIAIGYNPTNNPYSKNYYIRASHSVNQSHNSGDGTWDTVIYDSETTDNAGAYNNTTGLVTIPAWATEFMVVSRVYWASNTTGYRAIALSTTTNTAGSGIFEYGDYLNAQTGGVGTNVNCITGWIPTSVTSSFYVLSFQNSGGNLNMSAPQGKLYVLFR